MAEFNKTTVSAVVPGFVKEEGKIKGQTGDFVVFQTKKKRSSRGLTRYLSFDQIIAMQTDKEDNTTVWYLDPGLVIDFRNVEFDKLASGNTPGFVNVKSSSGLFTINRKMMRINTETSTAAPVLKKSKEKAEPKADKKKKKKD